MITMLVTCVVLAAAAAMRRRPNDNDLAALGMVAPRATMGSFRSPDQPR